MEPCTTVCGKSDSLRKVGKLRPRQALAAEKAAQETRGFRCQRLSAGFDIPRMYPVIHAVQCESSRCVLVRPSSSHLLERPDTGNKQFGLFVG